MDIRPETHGKTVIARPAGKIEGTNADEFYEELMASIQEGAERLIVNLEEISYISSAGLRSFAMVRNHAMENDLGFSLCSPSAPVRGVITTCGLHKLIPMYENERAAAEGTEAGA